MAKLSKTESQRMKVQKLVDKIDAKLERIKDCIYEIKDLEYDLLDLFPHDSDDEQKKKDKKE